MTINDLKKELQLFNCELLNCEMKNDLHYVWYEWKILTPGKRTHYTKDMIDKKASLMSKDFFKHLIIFEDNRHIKGKGSLQYALLATMIYIGEI